MPNYTVQSPTFGAIKIRTYVVNSVDPDTGKPIKVWRAEDRRLDLSAGGDTEQDAYSTLVDLLQRVSKEKNARLA